MSKSNTLVYVGYAVFRYPGDFSNIRENFDITAKNFLLQAI